MDGMETLHNMQEMEDNLNKDTPVIMLTANAIVGARESYLRSGFTDYISKPVKVEELEHMLIKYLPKELVSTVIENDDREELASTDEIMQKLSFLDTETGLGYCAGDVDNYIKILESYVENSKYDILQSYYLKKDWQSYRQQLQSVKGLSSNIGAKALAKASKLQENAAASGDVEFIEKHHKSLMTLYNAVLKRIRSALNIKL